MLNIYLTYEPAVALLEKWKLCSNKNLYMNIYSSSIHNCQKLETTQMSFNMSMDKQIVV